MRTGTIPGPEERLNAKLENTRRYCKETALELKIMFDAYIAAGFTEDQAFQMLLTVLEINSRR